MLIRDNQGEETVEDLEEYIKSLRETLHSKIDAMYGCHIAKDKEGLYEALSDASELYQCLVTKFLQAKTDLATKARYDKAQKVAKVRAETLGGYFNGKVG